MQFTASVEEEEGGPWKFAWDFGDGNKSTEQNPVHTYAKVGEYTATLTVTDQKNNKGTDEIDIFVENRRGRRRRVSARRGRRHALVPPRCRYDRSVAGVTRRRVQPGVARRFSAPCGRALRSP